MSSSGKLSENRPPPPRVLVVEDDSSTADALRRLLQYHAYEVLLSDTVAGALAHLDARPQYVLLDLMLPDGDGARVLEAIRDRRLDCRVLIITGVGDAERLERVRALGPDALLKKPLEFMQILEKLKAA